MDAVLQDLLLERLTAGGIADDVADLVLAACQSEEGLQDVLGGSSPVRPHTDAETDAAEPAGAYLRSITIEGFRGIGPASTLELPPGPGLTLVVGRNGSGKSSFAEGLELLLTGDSHRWSERSSIWAEGWRNLHHATTRVSASVAIEGVAGATDIVARWADGAGLPAADKEVVGPDGSRSGFETLGWRRALGLYRPFLSYNELGTTFDKDMNLFDALAPILGLEELTVVERRLADARLSLKRTTELASDTKTRLMLDIREVDDDKARAASTELAAKTPDLQTLARLAVAGTEDPGADERRGLLLQLAAVPAPDVESVRAAADELGSAAVAAQQVANTDSGHARQLVGLLREALEHHAHSEGIAECPVCGTPGRLTPQWRDRTEQQIARLQTEADEAEQVHERLRQAERRVRSIVQPPPGIVDRGAEVGLDPTALQQAWKAFADSMATDDPAELGRKVSELVAPVAQSVASFASSATAAHQALDDAWRPHALQLAAWIDNAREAQNAAALIKRITAAEKWLKSAMGELSSQRFDPISNRARSLWSLLRQQSNVDLGRVELEGTKKSPRRRVALDVTIDGVPGAAVSVMSQGELHALALSLFLPRATMPESPFRFMVIDDPVQAMDPARVDGLARVLDDVAASRQVVVFTHDDRLPEAVRRLGIAASVIEVTRRDKSVVELRPGLTPAQRAVDDALALAMTKELPPKVAGRVVPGMCRIAIEAACTEVVRRRRISRGEPHAEVETLLFNSTKLGPRVALALFDDATRTQEVFDEIKRRFGPSKVEVYQRANKGAHHGDAGDVVGLAKNCDSLVRGLLELR